MMKSKIIFLCLFVTVFLTGCQSMDKNTGGKIVEPSVQQSEEGDRTAVLTSESVQVQSSGKEIKVPGEYSTIQEAIDTAQNGDTVIVSPGTYYENISFKGKNITIRSTEPKDSSVVQSTVIDGGGKDCVVKFENSETRDAVLSGFTITNGKGEYGGGILIADPGSYTSATIKNNIITDNEAQRDGGGIFVQFSEALISNNIIQNNSSGSSSNGGGIFVGLDAPVEIIENTITGNTAGMFGGGLRIQANAVLERNSIRNNLSEYHSGAGGVSISEQYGNPTLIDNIIESNEPFDTD
jgi:parallel beta-helix repeat protein